MQLKHHEATPLLFLIMGSVVRPFIYFWPRLILSIYPLQLTLTADQQEKIHTAFYVPGLPRKTMWCTHIIQTHSQRHIFLVNLLHQGAGSIQIERGHLSNYGDECPVCNALYMQKERETVCEREKNRQRKARHTVLYENTNLCFRVPGIPPCTCWWNQIKRKLQGPCQSTKK